MHCEARTTDKENHHTTLAYGFLHALHKRTKPFATYSNMSLGVFSNQCVMPTFILQ